MAEVPEALDPKFHKCFCNLRGFAPRNAKYRNIRVVLTAEFVKPVHIMDRDTYHCLSAKRLLLVKYSYERKALGVHIKMHDKGTSHVPGTYKNCLFHIIETQYFADLNLQQLDVISVALLTEFSEAVEILSYLACGEPHAFGQLL